MLRKLIFGLLTLVLSDSLNSVDCRAATIAASQDTFIRGTTGETGMTHDNLGIWVLGGSSSANKRRGVIQFDLSGVTDDIADAHLEFYQMPDSGNTSNFNQLAVMLNSTSTVNPMDETTMTNTIFSSTYNADTVSSTLGSITLTDSSPSAGDNTYRIGASASAADLAILNARRVNADPSKRFALFWFSFEGTGSTTNGFGRIWGDHEGNDVNGATVLNPSHPILLVYTTVPEPAGPLMAVVGIGLLGFVVLSRQQRLAVAQYSTVRCELSSGQSAFA